MGYAILRTQKLKSGQAVRRSLTHAFREQETPNADPERTPENSHIGAENVQEALERFNARLPDKVRKNAVLAIEYLITASPEDLHGKTRQQQDAYFDDALNFLRQKHGAENVVYAGVHRDEMTPHMYAYAVPLDGRGKLNCRACLGGAKALSELQTQFAHEVGQQHGLQRGIAGSKARHTSIQQYYARANAEYEPLPEIKTTPPKNRPEPEKPGIFATKEMKKSYEDDHEAWGKEQKILAQYRKDLTAQRNAAVATVKRYEAQAREADALKRKVEELKKSNSHYVAKAKKYEYAAVEAIKVVNLFKNEEIQRAQERNRLQEIEKARQAEAAQRKAEIAKEFDNRVAGIQKLLQRGGATHTLAVKASEALRAAGNDPHRVNWEGVEALTVREAIGRYGQTIKSVLDAVLEHSPGCADPAEHQKIRDAIAKNAPKLMEQYRYDRDNNLEKHKDVPRMK